MPSLKCANLKLKVDSFLPPGLQFGSGIRADELEDENRMLFGDTDAQGLACEASISLRDTALSVAVLCAER